MKSLCMSKVKQGNTAAAVCASHAAVLTFALCGELVQAHCSTTQLLMHSVAPVGLNVCFCLEGLHAIMSVLGPMILHSEGRCPCKWTQSQCSELR